MTYLFWDMTCAGRRRRDAAAAPARDAWTLSRPSRRRRGIASAPSTRGHVDGVAATWSHEDAIDATVSSRETRGLSDDHVEGVAAVRHHLEGRKRTPSHTFSCHVASQVTESSCCTSDQLLPGS